MNFCVIPFFLVFLDSLNAFLIMYLAGSAKRGCRAIQTSKFNQISDFWITWKDSHDIRSAIPSFRIKCHG